MTLISYISIPYVSPSNEIKYIKIDLTTNKIFVKNEEVIDMSELTDDNVNSVHDSCDNDNCKCDKSELIDMLKDELDNMNDDDEYVAELRNIITSLDLLKSD